MKRKQRGSRSGTWLWIAGAVALCWVSEPAAAPFRMPVLRGFVEVDPGADLVRPPAPPTPHAARVDLFAESYPTDDEQVVTVDLKGRAVPGGRSAGKQVLTFEPSNGGTPVRLTLGPPFDLEDLIPEPVDGELHFRDRYLISDYNRSLVLLLEGRNRLQIVHAGAMEPVILGAQDTEVDLGLPGLIVRQGGAGAATGDPSHDYTHPVPVEAETADGTVTALWQGQWVALPTGEQDHTVHCIVLASEVAKPTGDAASVFEGARFNLQVMLVTQSP
jgi:hypothetical protein